MMIEKVKVSFELDADQKEGVNELAGKLGLSFSEVFRRAIGEYLAANGIELRRSGDVHGRQTVIPGCEE